jgi:hypothetical protein
MPHESPGMPLAEVGARIGVRTQGAVTMLLGRALSALGRELGEPAARIATIRTALPDP